MEERVKVLEELVKKQGELIDHLLNLINTVNDRVDVVSKQGGTLKKILDLRGAQIDNNANAISSIFKQIEQS